MKYANKIGAKYTLIIGDSEIDAGVAQLKNMADGSQTEVKLGSFTL
jgi:histidyl-tRNA synthetase